MKAPTTPKAPPTLSAEARAWWRKLTSEYAIRDEGGLLLLGTALQAFDRMRDAQRSIAEQGVTFLDRYGQPRLNPAAQVERDSRVGMLQALRALHLDVEPLGKPGRPSGSR